MNGITSNESLILELDKLMTDREVLSAMTDHPCEKGAMKDTYKQVTPEQEQSFPTGPKTEGINVAIPYADICHVNEAAICVAVSKTSAPSRTIGEPDSDVLISLVIMLALTEAHGYTEMLQRVVKLTQNQEDMKRTAEARQPDTTREIIEQYLLEDEN